MDPLKIIVLPSIASFVSFYKKAKASFQYSNEQGKISWVTLLGHSFFFFLVIISFFETHKHSENNNFEIL